MKEILVQLIEPFCQSNGREIVNDNQRVCAYQFFDNRVGTERDVFGSPTVLIRHIY
jgi:hypothetical protein